MAVKKIAVMCCVIAVNCFATAQAMTSLSFNQPYIGVSVGGTTMLSQSSHGNLTTTVEGFAPFYSYLYGHIQQENALGPVANLEAGYFLNEIFRAALALSYFQADEMVRTMATSVEDGSGNGSTTSYFSTQSWLFMANLYANIGSLFPFITTQTQPYVGLGLGMANNKMGNQKTFYDGVGIAGVSYSNSENNFAYKLMAGINYELTQRLLFNLQYAFLNAGNYESGRTGAASGVTFVATKTYKFPIYENQLTAGFIYKFT